MRYLAPALKPGRLVLAAYIAACVVLILVVSLFPHLGHVNELTVSGGVWTDSSKLRDVIAVPVAIALQLLLIAGLAFVPSPASADDGVDWNVALFSVTCMAILVWLDRSHVAMLVTSIAASFWYNRSHWHEEWQHVSGQQFVLVAAIVLAGHHLLSANLLWMFALLWPAVALASPRLGKRTLMRAGALSTGLLAVAVLLCAPYFWRQSTPGPNPIDALFVGAAAVLLARAARDFAATFDRMASQLIAPTPFALAIAVAFVSLPWGNPGFLSVDDYHFGELLLAYQATIASQGWFTSFLSPHGFSDALPGLVGLLAGDDSATGVMFGAVLFWRVVAVVVVWRLIARLGPVGGIFLGLALPIGHGNVMTSLAVLILTLEAFCIRNPLLAGAVGALGSATGIFFYGGPAVAAALTAGTAGLILHAKNGKRDVISFVGAAATASSIVIALAWPQVKGMIEFLKVSATSNLTIYGNGSLALIKKFPQHFIFVATPTLAVFLTIKAGMAERATFSRRVFILGIAVAPIVVLALLLNSYAIARLDDSAPRAMIASCILLAFLPIWLTFISGKKLSSTLNSAICALLLLVAAPSTAAIVSRSTLLPPAPVPPSPKISELLPRAGSGAYDKPHVQRLEIVARTVNAMLDPGETLLNLTNRNGFYFYFDRANPVPIASTYNAAPIEFQKQFIAAMGETPPPLALVSVDNLEHDGMSLPLRAHSIYSYVLKHYTPFQRDGYVFAIRNDLASRLERLPVQQQTFRLLDVTDANWTNGIAHGENAKRWSFAVTQDASLTLRVGDRLLFSDGVERRVTKAEGLNVEAEPAILLSASGSGEPLSFVIADRITQPLSVPQIWELAFPLRELNRIPSAWGRSSDRLVNEMQVTPHRLELAGTHEVKPVDGASDSYDLTGRDPQLAYRLGKAVTPAQFGLLELSVRCTTPGVLPRVQIFWRGADQSFAEEQSLHFEASNTFNIIPLDSTPSWTLAPDVTDIRVDISNPDTCKAVQLKGISLLRRSGTGELPTRS